MKILNTSILLAPGTRVHILEALGYHRHTRLRYKWQFRTETQQWLGLMGRLPGMVSCAAVIP